MNTQIIELIDINREVTWATWAVQYFFFIGISVGGFLLTLPRFVAGREKLTGLARTALLVALTTGVVAPIALVSDLHQPIRFYHFYLHFSPDSWMSWGSFFLPAYLMGLFSYAALIYFKRSKALIRTSGIFTTLGAALVMLYTGSEMGILTSRVLWNDAWMGVIFLFTGISGAAGLGLLLNQFFAQNKNTDAGLKRVLSLSLLIAVVLQFAWMGFGLIDVSKSGAALIQLVHQYSTINTVAYGLLLGSFAPLLFALSKNSSAWISGTLAIFGAWMFRWNMFMGGQGIPKNGAGFYPYDFPLGPEGLLGIVGSLGLWYLALLVISHFLALDKDPLHA